METTAEEFLTELLQMFSLTEEQQKEMKDNIIKKRNDYYLEVPEKLIKEKISEDVKRFSIGRQGGLK